MRTWLAKVMVACALVLVGGAAHSSYERDCVEGSPTGTLTCRLKPDGFTDWVYRSGYGVAPHEVVGGYITEEKAVQETLNYLIYTNPNYASMCQFSYSLGGVQVTSRDQFIQSQQSLIQFKPLSITRGFKNGNDCISVSTSVVEVRALRSTTCNHPASGNLGYWAFDKQSYMCVNPVDKTPPPCETCPQTALRGNPILVPTREKV
ncbi:hypothetical protein PMI14_06151 [Acidovorax sp. CF316]|uniref:hypothetical protein n=1 Tax=Acidovorax sp. CF316 TaxID=1144317 RepID=UPI00026BE5A6|nr:hypothetical protein [Acidovorax sp. CF316]EJE49299.1 hypothetical protein PMI14_06151 [Acidovorax sp. CF316]